MFDYNNTETGGWHLLPSAVEFELEDPYLNPYFDEEEDWKNKLIKVQEFLED